MATVKTFDFSQLDAKEAEWLRNRTHRVQNQIVNLATAVVEIGKTLAAIKQRIPYGAWQAWAECYLPWSQRKTDHLIRVARLFGSENHPLDCFTPSALYALASPDVAPSIRSRVMEMAEKGESITHSRVKEIIATHTPTPPDRTARDRAEVVEKLPKEKTDSRIAADMERNADAWLHVLDCLNRYGTIHIMVNEESEDDNLPLFTLVGYPKDMDEGIRRESRLNPAFAFAAMVDDEPTKKCLSCKKYLTLERYSSDSNSADKKANRCRGCEQRRQKIKRRKAKACDSRRCVSPVESSPVPQLAAV